jgi:hypothetical protein
MRALLPKGEIGRQVGSPLVHGIVRRVEGKGGAFPRSSCWRRVPCSGRFSSQVVWMERLAYSGIGPIPYLMHHYE